MTDPEPIVVVSFEVLAHSEDKLLTLVISGDTMAGDRQEVIVLEYDTAHRLVGRLLGGMVALDRERTLDALRSVLAANQPDTVSADRAASDVPCVPISPDDRQRAESISKFLKERGEVCGDILERRTGLHLCVMEPGHTGPHGGTE